MIKPVVFLLSASAVALAQPGIAPPALGAIRGSSGAVYAVVGIAGNFQLSDSGVTNAVSVASSGQATLVKTDTELLVLDGSNRVMARYDAPAGPALFAFDGAGAPALVSWSGALWQFQSGGLAPVNWTGQAVAIALTAPQSASIIVSRDGELWNQRVSLTTGAVETELLLAGVNGPVALLPNGDLVYANGNEILVCDGHRVERRVAAGIAIGSFALMGKDWIAVGEAGGSRVFVFRTNTRSPKLYQLPVVTE